MSTSPPTSPSTPSGKVANMNYTAQGTKYTVRKVDNINYTGDVTKEDVISGWFSPLEVMVKQ